MFRLLKALPLLAVITITAITAPSALAQNGVLTSDGPVTLVATQTGGAGANSYTAFGSKSECPSGIGTGHKYEATPHQLVPSGASTATMTPHAGVCTLAGLPATVDMNGCDGVYEIEGTTGIDEYAVKSFLICPPGKNVTLTAFGSAAKHTANEPFCITKITHTALGYGGVKATDTTDGFVVFFGTLKGIIIHRSSPTGSILCPTQTTESGEVHVDATGKGVNAGGSSTAISLSHN